MTFVYGLLVLFTSLLLPVLLNAAPQRRNCHSTSSLTTSDAQILGTSSSLLSETASVSGTQSPVLTIESAFNASTSVFTSFNQVVSVITTAITDIDTPTNTIVDLDNEGDILTIQNDPLSSTTSIDNASIANTTITSDENTTTTIPSRILLIYDNKTITNDLPTLFPQPSHTPTKLTPTSKPATFIRPATSAHNNNTRTSSRPTRTTNLITQITTIQTQTIVNIDAMQTAYYLNVCGWPEHANDAICLSENSMMCCRADNARCNNHNGMLEDGGLSCKGVESGNWARVWNRPTITADIK